jgi:hypothetical protein
MKAIPATTTTQTGLQGRSAPDSHRPTAVAVGVLILLGYLAYGPATAVIEAMLGAADSLSALAASPTQLGILAISMLVNSGAVVAIGVLMFRVAKPHGEGIALGYLGTRIFESIVMSVGIVFLLLQIPLAREAAEAGAAGVASLQVLSALSSEANFYAYQIAMIGLGVGSVPFWFLIYRSRLVPRPLAALGIIGYAVFAGGAVLEILGVEAGLILSIPGGLFEVAVAIWLIAKGFGPPVNVPRPSPVEASMAVAA